MEAILRTATSAVHRSRPNVSEDMKLPHGYGTFRMYMLLWTRPAADLIGFAESIDSQVTRIPGAPLDKFVRSIQAFARASMEVKLAPDDEENFLRTVGAARKMAQAGREVGICADLPEPEGWTEEDDLRLLAMELLES